MELSVVVTALNDRPSLVSCLDELREEVPTGSECIVVNGPSTDGTTGIVRERADVDVLVEISERSRSVARNAGIEVATGEAIAFVHPEYAVQSGWYDAIETALQAETDVITGPVKRDGTGSAPESIHIAKRTVTPFTSGNVAFDGAVLDRLDGFDEALETESASDCAHRLAANAYTVTWSPDMAVSLDGERSNGDPTWGERYWALGYRLAKNYGPRPTVFARTVGSALADGFDDARGMVRGAVAPTAWLRNGTDVVVNSMTGLSHGFRARYADRTPRRNPRGVSSRHDRAVQIYDRRDAAEAAGSGDADEAEGTDGTDAEADPPRDGAGRDSTDSLDASATDDETAA